MEVSITNSVPLTFAVFSLRYDLDGDNELDIVSFELWAGVPLAGGDYFGPLGPMSVSATEVNTINGATSNFVLPRTLPAGTYVMATIRWLVTSNVNSDGPDVASGLFNVGTDGFADGMFVPITDLAFGSATVDSAADPTHTSTPTPTATPTGTPAPLCPASLDSTGCVAPGKAVVVLKDQSPDDKDKMVFKWLKGTTAVGDFGDPLGADAYELCLYDNGSRAMYANVAAGGTCAGEDCWKAIGNPTKGYIYKDAGAGSNGIAKIILKAGTGIGKVLVKGSGTALPLPAPVSPGTAFFNEPVTVQVRNAAGNCWQASFPTSKKNTGDSFTAKTP
jgi:hypothetical protein